MFPESVAHYRITGKLGSGGMGDVFRATDTKLGREVALKVLPAEVAQDPDRRARFDREARAIASLKHPNIVTVYSVEEADGIVFLTMELVEGRTLSREITKDGLPIQRIFDIAIPLADAVSRAHESGIAHRDLKPANIMLGPDGTVKVLDFGLAKFVAPTPESMETAAGTETTEGMIVGTAAYMSPEQASGKPVDHRSDIFSLGIILYEMATGKRPFEGETNMETLSAVLKDEPPSATDINRTLPPHVARIIKRCLAKSPDRRYQTALDLRNELDALEEELKTPSAESAPAATLAAKPRRRLRSVLAVAITVVVVGAAVFVWRSRRAVEPATPVSPPPTTSVTGLKRLAVLPFGNLRPDPETNYLGYAVADQIISTLGYFKELSVRPSSAVRKYETRTTDAMTAGRELRVDYVVTGSYLKESDTIRLNVELVDVSDNEMVWRESVDAKYENAFALQDAVAEKVIEKLKVQFSAEERDRVTADVPQSSRAYDYYLRAVAEPVSYEGNERAIGLLEKSIELDSTFAPAFAEIGSRKRFFLALSSSPDALRNGERDLLRALELNGQNLQALGMLATHYMDVNEVGKAVEMARRAVSINPSAGTSHFALSYIYRYAGIMDEAVKEAGLALALDPGNPRMRSAAIAYLYAGDFDTALRTIDLDRESAWAAGWKGQIYMRMGNEELALAEFDRGLSTASSDVIRAWVAGMRAAITGDIQEGLRALAAMKSYAARDGELFYNIGNLYALLGDSDNCLRYLDRAVGASFFNYPYFLSDPFLDSVRDDPHFQDVLERVRAKHVAFKQKYFPQS